jgi:solute carrier family 25 (mitochondrial 2-oxodicarboxylate transporter), member 21
MSSPKKEPSLGINIAAGAFAGTLEILCMYPLDMAKTRQQLVRSAKSSSGGGGAQPSASMLHVMRQVVAESGIRGLYRGIASPIFAEAPKRATKFASNDIYKPLFASKEAASGALRFSAPGLAVSGALAGCTEALVNCPFETVKVRLQARENLTLYKSTFDCFLQTVRSEGVLALYRGLTPQLWRNAAWNSTYFSLIGTVKQRWADQGVEQSMQRDFCIGVVAGALATSFATPFDVAKSRMQNRGDVEYRGATHALRCIYEAEGFRALYKGFGARLARLGPGGGIMIASYSGLREFLQSTLDDD